MRIENLTKKMYRQQKLEAAIAKEISLIIKEDINDQRIGKITITRVKLSRDLKDSTIYFSVFGDKATVSESVCALEQATAYIRRRLAFRMHIKYVPRIKFKFDKEFQEAMRVHELLEQIKAEEEQKLIQ